MEQVYAHRTMNASGLAMMDINYRITSMGGEAVFIPRSYVDSVDFVFLMSMHIYFASVVLSTLFHNSLDVVRLAVRVNVLPLYVMRFPPTAILI
jgi:hypothetical protein